ncbi:unnamed protein product, partial [Brenthis ino]
MFIKLESILLLAICTLHVLASIKTNSVDSIKKSLEERQGHLLVNKSKTKNVQFKIENVTKINYVPVIPKKKRPEKMITPTQVQQWAQELSEKLYKTETQFVRRDVLLKGFSDVKIEVRNGPAIVEKTSKAIEELLERRGQAAEMIMRKAEELAANRFPPPSDYHFVKSDGVDDPEAPETPESDLELPLNCSRLNKVKLTNSVHFDANVSLEYSSVHVAAEVFQCDPRIIEHIHWTEGLISVFRENYAQDSTIGLQYLCSAKGFLRHYPAALWHSMYKLMTDGEDLYDCRLRPWYVSASGAPRDFLILYDFSGSMNSSNRFIAEQFTHALLNALTDDDQVNVLRFNLVIESPIPCFDKKLVPANHVNSAAMVASLKDQNPKNETNMEVVLIESIQILNNQLKAKDTPNACQQAIVLVTDTIEENYNDLMHRLDPNGQIRLFVLWLHDPFGLRDSTRFYANSLTCERDGFYAELVTDSDVTEQVLNILRVMERPLVAQRKQRLRVYSDVYANIEDPRRSEHYWQQKENIEQTYRYSELRRNKDQFLTTKKQYGDYIHMHQLDQYGQYYEGEDINYRLQISVSVPVFDNTTWENITITLDEEKQRNSTRTYPVNRLLGVAGVDIPIDHLKLVLPFYLIGAGGSLSIVDHRGNIVLHENAKPVFDGDILKPGYRTVDFLDVEQAAEDHLPREYPENWKKFRKDLIVHYPMGHEDIDAKTVYENGMRALIGRKDYYWKRVMDHYTVVVALPKFNIRHAVPKADFTQKLAQEAFDVLQDTEFAVHPEWLYCEHADPSKFPSKDFETREDVIKHFIERRRKEANFAGKKIKYRFSPIPPSLRNKTYQCNEELMARLCKEIIATGPWMEKIDEEEFPLGSVTAFLATESGLTRWIAYRATTSHAEPPDGALWSRGVSEPWFRRAVASKNTLVIHAPVAPIRVLRNSFIQPTPLSEKYQWLTAARTLGHGDHTIGVAGYHFYPQHLEDLLVSITNPDFDCEEDCEPRCDEEIWSCVLIDEEGWVVTYVKKDSDENEDRKPLREHLANLHPAAMRALLDAQIFTLHWIHDYQGVCFPPKIEKSRAPMLPSLVRGLWNSLRLIVHASHEVLTVLTLLGSSGLVKSETAKEKEKRRKRLRRDYEREKYERLYDKRVIVNRTRFAACDRSRPIYHLNRTKAKIDALRRPPAPCKWPLVGTEVPNTNLLLLAIMNKCEHTGKPLNNPLINAPILSELTESETGNGRYMSAAATLACLRNRVPLPARTPHTRCFPHNYSQEAGYRQCGPWLPDPDTGNNVQPSNYLVIIMLIKFFFLIINI